MKGIILAAGKGSRLGAATQGIGKNGKGISKGLIPTFARPTVYYPLSDLITAGINDIQVIAAPDNVEQYADLLGDGSELGIRLSYGVQEKPRGIAEAFLIAEDFIGEDGVALTFCDNIFSGESFMRSLRQMTTPNGARIFARWVHNPGDYGVAELDKEGRVISLEEKPAQPKTNYAVPGMYFYDNTVVEVARGITPSARGELEITDVNIAFMHQGRLSATLLDSDTDWFDTGTPESLNRASQFIEEFQSENGILLGSPEQAAYLAGFIDKAQLLELADAVSKSDYGKMLMRLVA